MRGFIRRAWPFIVIALLAAGAYVWRAPLFTRGSAAWARITGAPPEKSDSSILIVSGVIEAPSVDISAAVAGRIVRLAVADGDHIAAGQLVAEIDTSLLDARIAAAQSAVRVAETQAAQARAKPRETDLAVARASITQAQANAAAAKVASDDAGALIDASSSLDVDIARATTALQVATEQLNVAAAAATAADLEQQLWGRIVQRLEGGVDVPLPPQLGGGTRHVDTPADKLAEARLQWNLKSQAAWEAHAAQATALAAKNAARQALVDLNANKANPVNLKAQADAAAAAVPVAEAAIGTAQANLRLLEAGATAEQVAVADAAVTRAAAGRQVLDAQRSQYTIQAPRSGQVTEVILHEGEVAAAGAPVARQTETGEVTLTVYVPEARLGAVRIDGPVAVALDAFGERTFPGTVSNIAGEAEFTPKNVQTREERASTVFAVKVSLPNADAALKAGMPAEAFFCPSDAPCQFPFVEVAAESTNRISSLVGKVLPQPTATPTGAVAAPAGYAGSLEATSVRVAAEVGGRAASVGAAEGDAVSAGQVLVTIEGEELAAQRAEVAAAIEAARADLAHVAAGPQAERVGQAEAGVKLAEAGLAAAQARLAAAESMRNQPQDLDRQINAARQQIVTASAAVDAARAQMKASQVLRDSLQNPGSDEDKTRAAMYDAQLTAATAQLRAAEAQQAGASTVLARLDAIRANPVALDAAVHKAESDVGIAQAALEVAGAALQQAQAGPQGEAVAVAQARVAQAEAGLAVIDVGLSKLRVASPIAGQVIVQSIHEGEVVTPGTPLYTVVDLSRLRLAVYVPLPAMGAVRVGRAAQVTVDTFPGRTFAGTVTKIGQQAEYTPKNVQTAEERARMVIRVEITLDNIEGILRPGMGATAEWR